MYFYIYEYFCQFYLPAKSVFNIYCMLIQIIFHYLYFSFPYKIFPSFIKFILTLLYFVNFTCVCLWIWVWVWVCVCVKERERERDRETEREMLFSLQLWAPGKLKFNNSKIKCHFHFWARCPFTLPTVTTTNKIAEIYV
jgi:ABC-type transport system involved in Fe-S cluster assembly fused permease/ATPase subunit